MSDLPSQYTEEVETFRQILDPPDPRETFFFSVYKKEYCYTVTINFLISVLHRIRFLHTFYTCDIQKLTELFKFEDIFPQIPSFIRHIHFKINLV